MKTQCRGVSMVELMVAVLVVSVGLLGVAKIDAVTVSQGSVSSIRLGVMNDTASLAAAMRTNEMYWQTTTVPTSIGLTSGPTLSASASTSSSSSGPISISGTTSTTGTSTSGSGYAVAVSSPATLMASQVPSGNCADTSLACTPAQMAAWNLEQFSTALSTVIPTGSSTISCTPAVTSSTPNSPAMCQISVQWTENQVSINNAVRTAIGKQPTQTQTYTQMVQP